MSSPPPPKKRKLPTIKKNKIPIPAPAPVPATNPATSAPLPHQSPPTEPDKASNLPKPQRTPAALLGNADFDLRKPSVYAELFKAPGGSTPLSGLNRREKDAERRKELGKMRDEARAKRAAEAKVRPFDLQGQADKIARFEEILRQEKNAVLFPNFLGAKFKDDWERRRRKDAEIAP